MQYSRNNHHGVGVNDNHGHHGHHTEYREVFICVECEPEVLKKVGKLKCIMCSIFLVFFAVFIGVGIFMFTQFQSKM